MALGIAIGNEFLDLPPDAELELEQENPFLQFNDVLLGEYSLPIEVKATAKNMRLLGYPGTIEVKVTNTGIDAVVYDNGIPSMRGKIKIEKANINMNNMSDGTVSIYFLSGAAGFWQDVKDKKLRQIDMGGDRSFAFDDFATTGPGFWGHVRDIMLATPGYGVSGYDYAFFPVINKDWPGIEALAEIMNYIVVDGGSFLVYDQVPDNNEPNRIVPFPYLKYVMIQAAAFAGWKISGDILDDEDFIKIVMLGFRAINTGYIKYAGGLISVANDPIIFNLHDHLPNKTISEFFIALKNRFGWAYEFDNITKTVYITPLNDIASGAAEDFTSRASPVVPKQINQATKIYSLRNSFLPEISRGAPNFEVATYEGTLDEITDLPAAGEAYFAKVYLVVAENNFYICQQDPGTEVWAWNIYTYNIFDYEQANSTDDIITAATTVGNERYSSFLDLLPRIDQPGVWFGFTEEEQVEVDWGIILCFNHGVRNNKLDQPYPFASSGVYDSKFVQVAEWSLAFECFLAGGIDDVGLFELNWRRILALLNAAEEADTKLYLSRTAEMKLSFEDKISIRNARFFIKTKKPKIPYSGNIDLRVVRI